MSEPKKIWTPGSKPSERHKQIALMLFLECWKSALEKGPGPALEDVEGVYKTCLESAKRINKLETSEEQ